MTGTEPRRLRAAVDASLAWYEMVCAVHGVGHATADGVWRALGAVPPFHSAAKTVEPWATSEAAVAAVAGVERCSIADSFGTLRPTGFEVLFEARWLFREPLDGPPVLPDGWSVVRDVDALARWTARHGTREVLVPAVLDRPDVTVLAHHDDDRLVGGAVVQSCAAVAALSNVWADADADWDDVVRVVHAVLPGRPVVDHEHGDDLTAALAAGFQAVGPHVVWSR